MSNETITAKFTKAGKEAPKIDNMKEFNNDYCKILCS